MHCLYMSKTHTERQKYTHIKKRAQSEHVCRAIIVSHEVCSYSQAAIERGTFTLEPPARTCTDIDVEMKWQRKWEGKY